MVIVYIFMAVLAAVIWGFGYVVQSIGLDSIGPNTLNATRFILAFFVLLPFVIKHRKTLNIKDKNVLKNRRNKLLIAGIICGLTLFLGNCFQISGMVYTSAGKAGFITSLYIIIVPFISFYFGEKIRPLLWGCVLIALIGMYFLCFSGGIDKINKGDILVLVGALAFSVQILVVSYFVSKCDVFTLSALQFLFAGIFSTIMMLFLENPTITSISDAKVAILYSGIMNSAIACTLQVAAQKKISPTIASLIFSLEAVFALLFGWLILNETLTNKELLGCILVFTAVMLSQIPKRNRRKNCC